MVMAIGLLIDDTIVVVENAERLMQEQNLSPKEAVLQTMQEVTGALIGIAVVVTVVFIPRAFFSWSTGVIYRQFSVTIVSAIVLPVVVVLTLAPALCVLLLRRRKPEQQESKFQKLFARLGGRYEILSSGVIKKRPPTFPTKK